MNGIETIEMERRDQLAIESQTVVEDTFVKGELSAAAQCYTHLAELQVLGKDTTVALMMRQPPKNWPWPADKWSPSLVAKNNLRRAATLLVAEWERIDRTGV